MKEKLILAPGVDFYSEGHHYSMKGRALQGVTRSIAAFLKIKMPDDFVGEAQLEGNHIHGAVESWLTTGEFKSMHPGAVWVKERLETAWKNPVEECDSEVLVSDFKKFASSIDIVGKKEGGILTLYDIKRSFKRTYVTWQLSIYKYLVEKYSSYQVDKCFCLCVKDRVQYPIFPFSYEKVEEMLYGV